MYWWTHYYFGDSFWLPSSDLKSRAHLDGCVVLLGARVLATVIVHKRHFQETTQGLPLLNIESIKPIIELAKICCTSVGAEESVPERKDIGIV